MWLLLILGRKIQETFPGRLWVALLTDFIFITPNPPQLDQGVNDARKKLKESGFQGDNVFLAGHSLGGILEISM